MRRPLKIFLVNIYYIIQENKTIISFLLCLGLFSQIGDFPDTDKSTVKEIITNKNIPEVEFSNFSLIKEDMR